ncbi:MAG: isocitrate/isopropylmalate dehydrogenase family protein [Holophagales bacterium]|nr:isocitrate/isopropylmalate dehydrogenase family protein [Holophagales bacterium]MYD22251.1 isocitrate/isopropylmalate dehydrogenase family protein [Holophagales bacterium]MYI34209.1 isocitrate/isopropylmalate dehydrogenase family protein [Holophagales bacterium]
MTPTSADSAAAPVRLARIGGDGVGPEVVDAAVRVVNALCGDRIEWIEAEMGWRTFERTGRALPEATVEILEGCAGALFGAVSSPSHAVDGYHSPIVELRRRLDLYANVRPLKSGAIDAVVVRENTEGLYAGRERWEREAEVAIAERVISRRATERIVRFACGLALSRAVQRRSPARLTVVHKANVLRLSDGLFRETALDVVAGFPEIEVEEQLVDSMVYRLILEPERYDVIVAPNLYGDILSDAGAALVGGLGVVGSANCGERFCLAEPVHGSAPDIAGQGIANPVAAVSAAALLLERVGFADHAAQLDELVATCRKNVPRTPDRGGDATTEDVVAHLLAAI